MLLTLLYATVIFAQALYWGYHKDLTAEMDDKVWKACVTPGESND